jgi:serine/threonine protein kinase
MTFEWNQYIIHKNSIGKGSFSKVYYGFHKETRVEIALKKILFTKLQDPIKDKVISEINILQRVDHSNIMKLYEYKFDGDYIFLVMEYCNNNNLETYSATSRPYSDIRDKINQITTGIEYLHRQNIIHRDIKPQNILLHNDIIKIADFGFSIMIKECHQLMNTICGTPLYMSPELLSYSPYTIKSEIWALGILYYTMLYKVHPFGRLHSIDEYKLKISNTITYTPIPEVLDIISVLKTMLSYEATDRPTCTEILHTLTKTLPVRNQYEEYEDIFKIDVPEVKRNQTDTNAKLEYEYFSDEELDVTGRGKTNKGYDQVQIHTEYFTPPDTNSYSNPIAIPQSKSYSSSGSWSSGTRGSFFSSSIEKITSFFTPPFQKVRNIKKQSF